MPRIIPTHGGPDMHEFTSEQAARWDAWQQANAVSARRSDRVARFVRHDLAGGDAHGLCGRDVAIMSGSRFFKSIRERASRAHHARRYGFPGGD